MRKAIFLDRDGTLLVESGYVSHPSLVVPYAGTQQALRRAKTQGFLLLVVTNQSGIARGWFTLSDLEDIHERMLALLGGEAGIDGIYYCPHHPEGTVKAYRKHCSCRKPGTGLGLAAADRWGIDLARSFVIGDKMTDIDFGRALGARTCLVRTGFGRDEEVGAGAENLKEVHVADDIAAAVDWVLEEDAAR
jgi:D-glycero-D-manno-heptose 1,7-bisphosphate phosphatase